MKRGKEGKTEITFFPWHDTQACGVRDVIFDGSPEQQSNIHPAGAARSARSRTPAGSAVSKPENPFADTRIRIK